MRLVNRPAAPTIVKDLANGEKTWQAHPLDGEAIKTLVTKPGRETGAIATKSDGRNAWKIGTLGEVLPHAAARCGLRQRSTALAEEWEVGRMMAIDRFARCWPVWVDRRPSPRVDERPASPTSGPR